MRQTEACEPVYGSTWIFDDAKGSFSKYLIYFLSFSRPLNAFQRLCVLVHDAKCEPE